MAAPRWAVQALSTARKRLSQWLMHLRQTKTILIQIRDCSLRVVASSIKLRMRKLSLLLLRRRLRSLRIMKNPKSRSPKSVVDSKLLQSTE